MSAKKRAAAIFMLLALLSALMLSVAVLVAAQIAEAGSFSLKDVSDIHLRQGLALAADKNHNSYLDTEELAGVTHLDLRSLGIRDVAHLELFPNLTSLDISHNSISSLELSGLHRLEYLNCSFNKLPCLDTSSCPTLRQLICSNNFYEVPGRIYDMRSYQDFMAPRASQWTGGVLKGTRVIFNRLTDKVTYDYDCGNGFAAVFGLRSLQATAYTVTLDADTFPDPVFRDYLAQRFDVNGDGKLTQPERDGVSALYLTDLGITDLTGIRHFQGLTALYCSDNRLTSLDVSDCTGLQILYCNSNLLTQLTVTGCSSLQELSCYENQLTALELSGCPDLSGLYCDYNRLAGLDLGANRKLTTLTCQVNRLSQLDLSSNLSLEQVACDYNQLTVLTLPDSAMLKKLSCTNNQLSHVALHGHTLNSLEADGNSRYLTLTDGTFELTALPGFSVDKVRDLTGGTISGTTLQVTASTVTYTYQCDAWHAFGFTLITDYEEASENIRIDAVSFPDAQLRRCVAQLADTNGDGQLSPAEIATVTLLDLSHQGIAGLAGLEHFTALEQLSVGSNQLTALDLPVMESISAVDCSGNQLTFFNVAAFPNLELLDISENRLTALDLTNATQLIGVECSDNLLTEIKVNTALQGLSCSGNRLTSLDLSKCSKFLGLICDKNSYELPDRVFDLSTLPGFAVDQAGNWTGGSVEGTTLTVSEGAEYVTYTYHCGRNRTATFTLIPKDRSWLLGDVDGSGKVNIFDVTKLIYFINGRSVLSDSQLLAANVDEKGDVNVFDVMKLIYLINHA